MRAGAVEIPVNLDTKDFEAQIAQTEDKIAQLVDEYEILSKANPYKNQEEDLQKINVELEKQRNKLVSLRAQQEKVDYGKPSAQLDLHSKGLDKIIKKVSKWALAVFGVRSAYQFVRQSASTIGQYDKKIGADIEYIRFALAYTLKPIIEWLIKALYKILGIIGEIIYRITGYNIFQNSGAKAYEKAMQSSAKSTKKMAKDSKKIKDNFSAGFDEFTALQEQDTSSAGSSGGSGSDFVMPTMDLANQIGKVELPPWAEKVVEIGKWLVANKDIVLNVLKVAGALFVTGKVASWIAPLGSLLFGSGGSGGILSVLGKTGVIMGSLAVTGYSIYEWAKGNVTQQKQINKRAEDGVKIAKEDAKTVKKISDTEAVILDKRKTGTKVLRDSYTLGAKITGTSKELVNQVKSSVQQQDEYLKIQIEAYKQGKLSKEEQEKLKEILIDQVDYLGDTKSELRAMGEEYGYINEYASKYSDILVTMGEEQYKYTNAVDRTKYIFDQVVNDLGNIGKKQKEANDQTSIWGKGITAVKDEMKKIQLLEFAKKKLKIDVETDTKNADKTLTNLVKGFTRIITAPLSAMGMKAVADNIKKTVTNMTGIKLAKGGIVNNPGKGVPVGAIAGEAGAEAVIPLNDTTMNRLGEAIARHMNVNLTNVTEMNGRTISRELKKISNESNFSYNG